MKMYRIAIFLLALVLFPQYAAALDSAAPVLGKSTSPIFQSAPERSADVRQPGVTTGAKRADFTLVQASGGVHHIADWVIDSGDNKGLPFVIVDKTNARIFVFDAGGKLRGAAPVLLGLARGDDTVPGIGDRALADIRPDERTTPAGRFVAERGMSTRGVDIVWVDYDSAVSMHRVINSNAKERRLERLATATSADNRISFGCINVPVAFYNKVLNPSFDGTNGIVYVLPEIRPIRQVFGSYDVGERHNYAAQAPQIATIAGAQPATQ